MGYIVKFKSGDRAVVVASANKPRNGKLVTIIGYDRTAVVVEYDDYLGTCSKLLNGKKGHTVKGPESCYTLITDGILHGKVHSIVTHNLFILETNDLTKVYVKHKISNLNKDISVTVKGYHANKYFIADNII